MSESSRNALWQAWEQAEVAVAGSLLERSFGDVGLELSHSAMPLELLTLSPVRRHYRITHHADPAAAARMDFDALGITSSSVDTITLPHTLDFVESPQAVLREVERVLAGEGQLLITGFNPWSSCTPLRWLHCGLARNAQPLSHGRLCDWLQLLGFEIIAVQRYFRRPPVNQPRLLDWLEPLEAWRWSPLPGCGYAVLARKHVYLGTPLRLRPLRERGLGTMPRPVTREKT